MCPPDCPSEALPKNLDSHILYLGLRSFASLRMTNLGLWGQTYSISCVGGDDSAPRCRGRRLGAPYPLPLRGRWLLPEAKGGGRESEKSLPQSNALHLTAPSSEGAETAGASPRPTLILYFVRSKNTPTNPNLCIKMHTEKISVCAFGYILFNLRRFALTATLPRRCPYRLQHRDETAKSTRDNSARPARQSSLSSRRLSHCRWRSAQSFSPA